LDISRLIEFQFYFYDVDFSREFIYVELGIYDEYVDTTTQKTRKDKKRNNNNNNISPGTTTPRTSKGWKKTIEPYRNGSNKLSTHII